MLKSYTVQAWSNELQVKKAFEINAPLEYNPRAILQKRLPKGWALINWK